MHRASSSATCRRIRRWRWPTRSCAPSRPRGYRSGGADNAGSPRKRRYGKSTGVPIVMLGGNGTLRPALLGASGPLAARPTPTEARAAATLRSSMAASSISQDETIYSFGRSMLNSFAQNNRHRTPSTSRSSRSISLDNEIAYSISRADPCHLRTGVS
jgi:hypothetical protein